MPLRDHFHRPHDLVGWDGVHGGWPMVIVQHLFGRLPRGYVAAPRVHIGRAHEIDIGALESDDRPELDGSSGSGGSGTALWAPSEPTLAVEADLSAYDEYEVRIYDDERRRQLVAAIELISPSNKDRPESRRFFAGKCATLLAKGVSVVLVDLVTKHDFNLYSELLDFIGREDPSLPPEPPAVSAAACRLIERPGRPDWFQTWYHPLAVGRPLPTLPLWLDRDLAVPLDLEATYEETCRVLHLT